jgi:hypothetical protein
MTENIVTGKKFRILTDATNKIYDRISFWTKASDVEFNDGGTAESKLGSISGVTDSLTSTSSSIAASAAAVKGLNDKITELSTSLNGSMTEWKLSNLLTGGYKLRYLGRYCTYVTSSVNYTSGQTSSTSGTMGTTKITVNSDGSITLQVSLTNSNSNIKNACVISKAIDVTNVDGILVEYSASDTTCEYIGVGLTQNYDYTANDDTWVKGNMSSSATTKSGISRYTELKPIGATNSELGSEVGNFILVNTGDLIGDVYIILGTKIYSKTTADVTFKHIYTLKKS